MKSGKKRHIILKNYNPKGKMEKILSLLKNNDFISGEQIAKQMGISRAAVWKQVEKLRNMGYEIISKKGVGYKLISKPDIPYPHEVKPINTKIIGNNVIHYKTIPSTNMLARQLAQKGVKEGTVIIAEMQTAGKGRKDRKWLSPPGGLWLSVILYPSLPPEKGGLMTMTASIAVVDGIKESTGLKASIKWPNDVLVGEKKVCGILTEIEAKMNEIDFAIVGIGINVYNPLHPSLKTNATTLFQCTKKKISRIMLLQSILQKFDEYYLKLLDGDYENIIKKWISFSHTIGRKVVIKEGGVTIKGKAVGIDENGYLLVEDEKKIHKIISGDISYV